MYSVLEQIKKMYPTMTPVEKRIAKFILNQPEEVTRMAVKKIAEASKTSDAAVVRFAKRIGLSGIKELKIELVKELTEEPDTGLSRIINLNNDGDETIFQKVFHNTLRSLYNTEKIIDYQALTVAARMISKASRTLVFGVSDSGNTARDIEQKLQRLNFNAYCTSDRTLMLERLKTANEKELLFVISAKGHSKEVIDILRFAKEQSLTVIVLSQQNMNHLTRYADISIEVSSEEANVVDINMTNRISQLMVIDVLFFYICKLVKDNPSFKKLNIIQK
ncbi:MurR/RpiR family transcriptional regulator [Phocicoccus pinnipedialis]|uniref:Putative HTH-type transcriptional regulator YbbH n=1 Tax=Phocicoccus pinnipedialis TaxID=110845 RepID=A0A6V7R8C7_9BACL|nr:MurR/RpiR family transcriptional regulator [Jeotgalicoccus pinnipedialis]MBP1940136.1 DNA-binding MurR/RpiR family transcriptional regulator [Jeotgalicoccus pinnipedialis]CAD2073699.1 putative HTH-type transcriptional regulator YbbH [Jeotgalicoccus pinnipedialis]